jgi:tRNA-2-methylthio-N6-dimethylallyladenosine synthase
MQRDVGKTFRVLIEGDSRKSDQHWAGRTDHNKMVVFPKTGNLNKGDYADVFIESCTAGTLMGEIQEENKEF